MDAVTSADRSQMMAWGRAYVSKNDKGALNRAAEYIAIADTAEVHPLWYWWNEGTRNTAISQFHVNEANAALFDRAAFIQNQLK